MCYLPARLDQISNLLLDLKCYEEAINEIHNLEPKLGHMFCETLMNEERDVHRRVSQCVIELYNTNNPQQFTKRQKELNEKTHELYEHTSSLNELLKKHDIIYTTYLQVVTERQKEDTYKAYRRELEKQVINDEEKQRIKDDYKKRIEDEAFWEHYSKRINEACAEEREKSAEQIKQLQKQISENGKLIDELKERLYNANSIILNTSMISD